MALSRLAGVVFACAISLTSTSIFSAPADDGRCDVLLYGGTPTLYGLCVAYWTTHERSDPGNPKSPANTKILEKYVEKMQPGDPYMPNLPPPDDCPCWRQSELYSWVLANPTHELCSVGFSESDVGWGGSIEVIPSGYILYSAAVYTDLYGDQGCIGMKWDTNNNDEYVNVDANIDRNISVTPTQYQSCRDDVIASIAILDDSQPSYAGCLTTNSPP